MRRILALAAACLLWTTAVSAQEEEHERVELRVSAAQAGGLVIVDRGESDGLVVGDLVFFHPRSGGTKGGNVIEIQPRSCLVEMHDRSIALELGTRGEVLVPVSRFQTEPGTNVEGQGQSEGGPETPEPVAENGGEGEIVWTNPDTGYLREQPLLTAVRPVRPEERTPQFSGRVYLNGDGTFTTLNDRSDAFLRAGADLVYENPFGRGGGLHFDGEVNYRMTQLPDRGDENFSKLRVDRLAYNDGGTRFEPFGWEAGRFLQRGLPEFGVLDGVEWGWRLKDGNRYGFSLGFMPEPDADFSTGQDFQFAAYYHWEIDPEKRFTIDGGFQKTLHNGDADRDLLVAKLRYAPPDAWHVYATTWIDYYGSSDRVKGTSIDLTQALLVLSRRGERGGVDWTFTHHSFPELERYELQLVEDDQLEDDHDDRLSFSAWRMAGRNRLHGRAGAWADEEEEGVDGELGIDFDQLFWDRSHTDITGFVSQGEFTNVYGAQTRFGRFLDDGSWDLFYEFTFNNNVGFDDDVDDILQHRLRASRNIRNYAGWNVALHAEARSFDDEGSLSVGFYLQRSY